MTDPNEPDPAIPPAMTEVRDLTAEEYDATYADGTGGHELPAVVLEGLAGWNDPAAMPPVQDTP